jgi:adenylosuccinate synthase
MKHAAVIGGQVGDEGKGRFIIPIIEDAYNQLKNDAKVERFILSHRWQGGGNAGHTSIVKGLTYKLHQLPTGILHKAAYAFLGAGMFINPKKLREEIHQLQERGILVNSQSLGVSSQAHVTLEYHVLDDASSFNLLEHSSTGNGIKQTARDKAYRLGIRFGEFLDKKLFVQLLEERFSTEQFPEQLKNTYGTVKEFAESYFETIDFLSPYLASEQEVFSNPAYLAIVSEGSQGAILDQDYGLYPGATSSNPILPTHRPDVILAVFKAYVSSVGMKDRAFVTHMPDDLEATLVEAWQEKGTTTGKPRHLGWFDCVAGKYAMQVSHADYMALTCLDRLETLHEMNIPLKVVTHYQLNGCKFDAWDASFDRRNVLSSAKPIYREFPTWATTVVNGNLCSQAETYVRYIEETLGKKIVVVGTGPEDKDLIERT